MQISTAYCPVCRKQVRANVHKPNHILHLLLSLVTWGFWFLFVWLPLLIRGNSLQCQTCASWCSSSKLSHGTQRTIVNTAKILGLLIALGIGLLLYILANTTTR